MNAKVKTGQYVHVVATLNVETGEGRIRYVNPATTILESDAKPDPNAEIVVADAAGNEIYRSNVVVRRSSPEPDRADVTALIQADLPLLPGMKSVSLLYKGKPVDTYQAGEAPVAPPTGMALGLAAPGASTPHRRHLTVGELGGVTPAPGVTYTVQVKPGKEGAWNTIAVGRPTPSVDLDRNQFPGSKEVKVRVLRTTGFEEDVIVDETIDLS